MLQILYIICTGFIYTVIEIKIKIDRFFNALLSLNEQKKNGRFSFIQSFKC
jgi:hypothetical protein